MYCWVNPMVQHAGRTTACENAISSAEWVVINPTTDRPDRTPIELIGLAPGDNAVLHK
jgi:hypothetical protein